MRRFLTIGAIVVLLIAVALLGRRDHVDRVPAPRDVLRSDLRELALAQELYAAQTGTYAPLDSLDFAPSADVTVTQLTADASGWSATVQHPPSGTTCTLTVHTDSIARDPTCTNTP